MDLLLVEDDEHKRGHLLKFLARTRPQYAVRDAKSYQSGLRAILSRLPDIVLLDMSVPTFDVSQTDDGGRPQRLGGREILRQLQARGLRVPCLVITQFDSFGEGKGTVTAEQLDEQMTVEHPGVYLGMVAYDPTSAGWTEALLVKLDAFEKGQLR